MAAQTVVMTLRPPVPAAAHDAAGRCGSGNSASGRRGTPSGSFGRVVLTARHLASRRPRQGLAVLTVDVAKIVGPLRLRLPGLAGGGRRTGSSRHLLEVSVQVMVQPAPMMVRTASKMVAVAKKMCAATVKAGLLPAW